MPRYRPRLEPLESKMLLSADLGLHQMAAHAHRPPPRLIHRQLDPSNLVIQGTVIGFMKVESFYAGGQPGQPGSRRFTILNGRGRLSELGPVHVSGSVFEYTQRVGMGQSLFPVPNRPSGILVLRNARGTVLDLGFHGAVVPPGTAFTDGPNYVSPDFLSVRQTTPVEQNPVGVLNLSFPRGQPLANGRPKLFVINILVATQPAGAETS